MSRDELREVVTDAVIVALDAIGFQDPEWKGTRDEARIVADAALTAARPVIERETREACAKVAALSWPDEETAKGCVAWNAGNDAGERRATAAIVAWLTADEGGRGLVEYRDCWNIAMMLGRGDHITEAKPPQD
jgi:hypothetical protein